MLNFRPLEPFRSSLAFADAGYDPGNRAPDQMIDDKLHCQTDADLKKPTPRREQNDQKGAYVNNSDENGCDLVRQKPWNSDPEFLAGKGHYSERERIQHDPEDELKCHSYDDSCRYPRSDRSARILLGSRLLISRELFDDSLNDRIFRVISLQLWE